jgi:anti-sigma factor RsiW
MNTAHPSYERLVNLAQGLLGALERSRVEQHVAQCPRCLADLARLAEPRSTPTNTSNAQTDRNVLARARQALHPRSRKRHGRAAGVEQFSGALRFDSATMTSAFGIRGSADGSQRQLLFEAGPFEIELRTTPAREGWRISGQVLGPTEATFGEVRLVGTRANARSIMTELLEFNLPVVPAGTYGLELDVGTGATVRIESLELRP